MEGGERRDIEVGDSERGSKGRKKSRRENEREAIG